MAVTLVNDTLKQLKSIFTGWRAAFKSQQEVDLYKQSLMDAMISHGIGSQDMIDKGLKKAKSESIERDFMPPADRFVYWCKPNPEDFGLPTAEEAYEFAAIECGKTRDVRDWQKYSPVIYWAANEVGFHDLGSQSEKRMRAKFARCYQKWVEKIVSGDHLAFPEDHMIENESGQALSKSENAKRAGALLDSLLG